MIDLVVWSFVVVLTPVALGLAWKLISGVGHLIDFGQSLTREEGRSCRPRYSLNPDKLSAN